MPVGHSRTPSISSQVGGHVGQADLVREHVGRRRVVGGVHEDVLAPLAGLVAEGLGHKAAVGVAVHDPVVPVLV